jgi:two-component system, OmpR family, phosphate regulon response regulator PhoB
MSSKTAVVIDDEEDITTFLSTILEENGFTVRVAHEAAGGEDLIRESPPDIILLDIMMPGRSGVQLFARLRGDEATRGIPLMIVSGIKDQLGIDFGDIGDRMSKRKPDGVVEKPIDPERLMDVVNRVLSREGAGNEVIRG